MADVVAPPTGFHKLPTELQLVIWEQAVLEDHKDRVVPLTQDKRVVLASQELRNPSGVLRASPESRQVALGLYDQALPVVPFYSDASVYAGDDHSLAAAALREEGRDLDATHDCGVVRVSFRLDIFLVSAHTQHFQLNKSALPRWSDLGAGFPDLASPPVGPDTLPRHMTWALTAAMRAQIERLMEVRLVTRRTLPGRPVRHRFDTSEYASASQCVHKESLMGQGIGVNTRRFLWHMAQGYSSAELLTWLEPDVHSV